MTITRKGERGNMERMTKEEMQRFLNREAEKGSTEIEALKALAEILGIKFPGQKKRLNNQPGTQKGRRTKAA